MIQQIPKKLLKQMRQLRQKKFRRSYGLFVISGLRAVQLAMESPLILPKYLLVEKEQTSVLNRLPAFKGQAVFTLSPAEFSYMSDEKTPQGIALVAELPRSLSLTSPLPERMIYLERIADPGNFGTILRTALWFGWPLVLLSPDSLDPYQPKAIRASAGAIARVRIVEDVSLQTLEDLKNQSGYRFVGTRVQGGKALPKFTPRAGSKYILAFGSEAHGLSQEILRLCSEHLTIPKAGYGESLNLAIAVSLFLYQFSIINSKAPF